MNKTETWSWIWKLKLPPKIKLFIWKCTQHRIRTKSILFSHSNHNTQFCPRCNEIETPIHVLWDSDFARNIWASFTPNLLIPDFFNLPLHPWCKQNMKITINSSYIPWNIIFAFTIWAIWLGCNSLNFYGINLPHQILKANSLSHDTEFFFLSSVPESSSPTYTDIAIRWCPAPFPQITINTDGSSKGNPGPSRAGGLTHSNTGEWLWGFSVNLDIANNTMAELWGIRKALLQAWYKGHRRITLQTDSLLAAHWLNTNVEFLIEISNLILDCRWSLNRDWGRLVLNT